MPFVSPAWPTSDHIIPWRLFTAGFRRLRRILAMQRVSLASAVQVGELLAQPAPPDTDAKARASRLLEPHLGEAYPPPGMD
jgi:hypothetical protein